MDEHSDYNIRRNLEFVKNQPDFIKKMLQTAVDEIQTKKNEETRKRPKIMPADDDDDEESKPQIDESCSSSMSIHANNSSNPSKSFQEEYFNNDKPFSENEKTKKKEFVEVTRPKLPQSNKKKRSSTISKTKKQLLSFDEE